MVAGISRRMILPKMVSLMVRGAICVDRCSLTQQSPSPPGERLWSAPRSPDKAEGRIRGRTRIRRDAGAGTRQNMATGDAHGPPRLAGEPAPGALRLPGLRGLPGRRGSTYPG